MPPASTKSPLGTVAESAEGAQEPRVVRAKRRIGERFYDRVDVRRMLAALILKRVRRNRSK
ncbi:MAG: hypothetical protein ACRENN_03895 [Candidatus Eiseniibacteriota bacterium]